MLDQLFFLTVLLVFLVVLTSIWLQRKRDGCLLSLHGSEIKLLMDDGVAHEGVLTVYHTGLEINFKSPMSEDGIDRFSRLILQPELKSIVSIARYPHLMTNDEIKTRDRQIRKSWHPSAFSKACRKGRNILNLLGDAFHQSLSLFLGRLKQLNGTGLGTQQDKLQKIGSSMIDLAANAYEPILEPWIGHRIVVEGPEGITLTGILKDYSALWIELLDVSETEQYVMDTSQVQKIGGIEFSAVPNEAPHGSVPKTDTIQLFNTNPWSVWVLDVELSAEKRTIKQEIPANKQIRIDLSPAEVIDSNSLKISFQSCKKADICLPRAFFIPRYGAESLI